MLDLHDPYRQILLKVGASVVYENDFKRHLVYAMGSLEETKIWFLFAKDCSYLSADQFQGFKAESDALGARLYKLFENWKSF